MRRSMGRRPRVMVDTGASHNFIKAEEAKRLGLKLDKGQGWMKTVNTKAKPVDGMARGIELHLGGWRGKVNFSITSLDDYDVVLGMEFLREFNVALLPHNNTMCIMEGGPYMVPMVSKLNVKLQLLSAMYIKLETDKKEVVGIAKKMTSSAEDSPPPCPVVKSSIGQVDKANLRRRKSRRKPATSRKKTRRGRREHRWGRMSRPAKLQQNCLPKESLMEGRLRKYSGSSWKT
ncbi:hypothetical protein CsSME_00045206 [Camellia sinensis var. sinensis]